MRKNIVAGNWKMNLSKEEASSLFNALKEDRFTNTDCELMIFPAAIYLGGFLENKNDKIQVGAQNAYFEKSGAFTGEISMNQLASNGANAVLIGHSERREIFGESNEMLKQKVNAALENNIQPIFCCGEPQNIREEETHVEYVLNQLKESIFHLDKAEFSKLIIAYEPIWAIGTGLTATSQQAEDMHLAIRNAIYDKYDVNTANEMSILYGGSCKPSNAKEIFGQPNVDGGLIGGAALNADDFYALTQSF